MLEPAFCQATMEVKREQAVAPLLVFPESESAFTVRLWLVEAWATGEAGAGKYFGSLADVCVAGGGFVAMGGAAEAGRAFSAGMLESAGLFRILVSMP
jgi:hypothetical protein